MPRCQNINTRNASNSTATRTSSPEEGGRACPHRVRENSFVFLAGSDNGSEPGALRSFSLDEHGVIVELARADAQSPIYFALSRDKRFLYVAQKSEVRTPPPAMPGAVAAYEITPAGAFRKINEIPCAPSTPCHVSISANPPGEYLLFAEYGNGVAGLLRIREDGSLEGPPGTVTHCGTLGPNTERQERPHCHCIVQAPGGPVFVCDLGTDEVVAYDLQDSQLRRRGSLATAPGAGPRHIVFDKSGEKAYLLNELDNTLSVLCGEAVPVCAGTFSTVCADNVVCADFSKAAAVKISPCGNWVLASNRGHDSIAAFRINGADLAPPVISKLTGRFPRDFEFSPDGKFVIVGHKLSDEIASYRFDPESGALTPTGNVFPMVKPLCFTFR